MEKRKAKARPSAKTKKKSNVTKVKTIKHKKTTTKRPGVKKTTKKKTRTDAFRDYVIIDPKSKKIILEAHYVDLSKK